MEVPNIEVIETEKVVRAFEDEEEITVGVYINFNGDINKQSNLLDKASSDNLVRILFGKKL